MTKIFSTAVAGLLLTVSASAIASEAANRDILCRYMQTEVTLPNGTRADCISDTHAIEVEWTANWAEAIGQSLSYASSTGKKPGVFLICKSRESTCKRHLDRMLSTIRAWGLGIEVWMVEDKS